MKVFIRIIHFFILLVFLIIQIVLLEQFSIWGVGINLLFVCIIAVSIIDGYVYGMLFGFLFGILLDLLTGGIIGVNALVFTLSAYISFRIYKLGFKRKLLTYIIIVPIVSVIEALVPSLIYYIFGYGINPLLLFIGLFLIPAVNTVLVFPIFPLIGIGSTRKEEIGFLYKKKI